MAAAAGKQLLAVIHDQDLAWEKQTEGNQGVIGIVRRGGQKLIYKVSQSVDNLIQHEYSVMRILNELADYCVHFNRCVGLIQKSGLSPSKYSSDVLLMEYIPHVCSFRDFMDYASDSEVISITLQGLMAIWFAQSYGYTHYDLHAENILITRCSRELILEYHIENQVFRVKTYGYIAVIIDHGFAYIDPLSDEPPVFLTNTLWFVPKGYLGVVSSPIHDCCRLLLSVESETQSPKLRKWIEPLFSNFVYDEKLGWDVSSVMTPPKFVHRKFRKAFTSGFLKKYPQWVDSIQLLINLPLTAQSRSDGSCFKEFAIEWNKIELDVGDPETLHYLFHSMCLIVKENRPALLHPLQRKDGYAIVKAKFMLVASQVTQFFMPTTLDYERICCSLLLMANAIEYEFKWLLEKRLKEKEVHYSAIPLQTPEEFFKYIYRLTQSVRAGAKSQSEKVYQMHASLKMSSG